MSKNRPKTELELQTENQTLYCCLKSDDRLFFRIQYRYYFKWREGQDSFSTSTPEDWQVSKMSVDADNQSPLEITGVFGKAIRFRHTFRKSPTKPCVEETLLISNALQHTVTIEDISCGFCGDLANREDWRLIAVPFRIQADGKKHDYTCSQLIKGHFSNSDDEMCWTTGLPSLVDRNLLRSEAWLWTNENCGLLIAKYNNENIEMAVTKISFSPDDNSPYIQLGGVGLSLFGEPAEVRTLEPEANFTFGITHYEVYAGHFSEGFKKYKQFLNSKGHNLPCNYNPPVNWNVLYDLGWHHSNQAKLQKNYTLDSLLAEAQKAQEIGCELLYLDPGWEICEGTSLWDEKRMGKIDDFRAILREKYGLKFGYRDTAFLYRDEFPHAWYSCPNPIADRGRCKFMQDWQRLWPFCAPCESWRKEKLRRIKKINNSDVDFMMFDEYAWFGPCFAEDHGHGLPSTPSEHVKAVFDLVRSVAKNSSHMLVEVHDPVWPWGCRYLPVYFKQGFNPSACYQENWGFEFMWDCLKNLMEEGRAKALYYYAMACDIPLYLHISMIPDNDQCLFFWWAASTVRHLGIGGKYHNYDPKIREKYCPDPETRWNCYKDAMKVYRALKEYFVRGKFHGLHEEAHLHTLEGTTGGVLNVFNISEQQRTIEVSIEPTLIGVTPNTDIASNFPNNIKWTTDGQLHIHILLEAASPQVVVLGDAYTKLCQNNLRGITDV